MARTQHSHFPSPHSGRGIVMIAGRSMRFVFWLWRAERGVWIWYSDSCLQNLFSGVSKPTPDAIGQRTCTL